MCVEPKKQIIVESLLTLWLDLQHILGIFKQCVYSEKGFHRVIPLGKTHHILFFNHNPALKDGASELIYITINADTFPEVSACTYVEGVDRYVGNKNSKLNGIYVNMTFSE